MAAGSPGIVPAPDDAAATKRALRSRTRQRRTARSRQERADAAAALDRLLPALCERHAAATVTCFLSRDDEPSTRGFLSWARERGIRVLLPISQGDGTLHWAFDDGSERVDARGMPAPGGPALDASALASVALAIVPAALIDRTGGRLGWGGGYIDRALAGLVHRPPVYAVVFDDEFVESLPREAHDIPVDGVVTPSGITEF